jgi:pimeloyl-ACP methyl ester carboxylesterase
MSRRRARAPSATRAPRAPRDWEVRSEIARPRASFEELEIRASDGTVLRALVDDPPEGVALSGTVVLAHAMLARKSTFGRRDRPGLSSELAARGFRTVAFDFRGHGDSVGLPEWGYDDLVRRDLPAVVECARARGDDKPVIVLGHSLGGTVALAAQGSGRIDADALVVVGSNIWLRRLEPSRLRWAAKTAIARAVLAVSSRASGLPARRLRLGTDDASGRYVADLFRGVTDDAWSSADGRDDYFACLAQVRVPVAAVLGERDRLLCHPDSGEAFARRCAGPIAVFGAPAGHMDLVTDERSRTVVAQAVDWAVHALP